MPGKGGLGRERHVKEQVEEKRQKESRRFQDFRQRKQGVFSERRVEADLRKSQRSCEQLDSAKVSLSLPPSLSFSQCLFTVGLVCRELKILRRPTSGQLSWCSVEKRRRRRRKRRRERKMKRMKM